MWWLTEREVHQIGEAPPAKIPAHVKAQYQLLRTQGAFLGGKLWADARLGKVEILGWPDTLFARLITESHADGIVLRAPELALFTDDVGGFVTDLNVRLMVIK